ncbi:MAG: hypothetical protein HY735_32325 [Verrucomicrobia bacterium]|nr:hypothetical protein [Verrucomicrobiota bacterium]
MAEATTAAPTKPKRGIMFYLMLLGILAVAGGGGWFGFNYFTKKKTAVKAAVKTKDQKEGAPSRGAPKRLPVPLADGLIVYLPGKPRDGIPPRAVTTNAFKVNSTKPNQIYITFADPGKKKRYGVAQLYLAADNTDALVRKINEQFNVEEQKSVLFESVTNLLSAKLHRDTKVPGFRKILRSEIIGLVNRLFETNLVQEVIIPEFITQ